MKTLRVIITINLIQMIICAVCGIVEYYFFFAFHIFGALRVINAILFFFPWLLNFLLAPLNIILIIIYAIRLRKREHSKSAVVHLWIVSALTAVYITLHYTELTLIMRAMMSV